MSVTTSISLQGRCPKDGEGIPLHYENFFNQTYRPADAILLADRKETAGSHVLYDAGLLFGNTSDERYGSSSDAPFRAALLDSRYRLHQQLSLLNICKEGDGHRVLHAASHQSGEIPFACTLRQLWIHSDGVCGRVIVRITLCGICYRYGLFGRQSV